MAIKSKFYYYPSNFNLEEFSTTNNLPINKVAGILNLFIIKPKKYSNQREISLSAKLLKKNFGDIYSKIINCLMVNGVIENTFGYSEGVSRKYQLSDYYQYSEGVKKHLKTTDNLNLSLSKLNEDRILTKYLEELKFPKIKRVSKIPNYLFKDWYSPLIKWLSDGKLTIDVVKAQKILEMNNIKTFEPDKYLEYLAMIDIFKEKDFNLKSDKNFRFYSSLTNLPKILRGCLLYSGKKLAGTDISNTQPLFLGTLCDRLFLKELRAKKNIDVDDILFNEFILHLESNPKDLIQFNKLVQTGNLYESFTDIGQEFTREIIKDNLIKVINDKGIDKNKYKVAIRRALNERFPTISLLLNMLKSKNHKYVSSTLMSIEAQNFVINFPHEFYYKPEHSHIPLFMVHDCFFTIEQHIDYLENFIKEYYKSYLSIDLPMKREKMV